MRITNKMISNGILSTTNDVRKLMADLQLDLATGKKIRKPSDDANANLKVEKFKELQNKNEQYLRNISQITGWIDSTTVSLESISDVLMTAKEKATQAASETVSEEVRASLATMIDQEIDTLISLGNTNYSGKNIFGGTITINDAPFSRSGDVVSYNGNDGNIKGKIGFNATIQYNRTGEEVFSPAGGVDIFNTMTNLKLALEQNDTSAIQTSIDLLDDAIKQTNSISSGYGILQNRLSMTQDILRNENLNLLSFTSELQDTDIAEAILKYQNAETAYTAMLKTTSTLVQTSLVDYLV